MKHVTSSVNAFSDGTLEEVLQLNSCSRIHLREQGSSVSIVSGYGLDDRAIEVRTPAEAKGCFLTSMSRLVLRYTQPPVQWVPGVLSPGVKSGRGVTLTTHPHLVSRSRINRSYTSSHPNRLCGV
jgi:hypothetical protein